LPVRRLRLLALVAQALVATACQLSPTVSPPATAPQPSRSAAIASALPSGSSGPSGPSGSQLLQLQTATLPWRLATAVSRAVAFADGDSLLLAGGLTASGTVGSVVRIDITSGAQAMVGQLARPVHDAGAALVAGTPTVIGGGDQVAETVVQRVGEGRGSIIGALPRPRADLAAVDVAGTAYVVGGGTASKPAAAVLATNDGSTFAAAATLVVAVRYAAVAPMGSSIIVVGGFDGLRDRTEIQSVDTVTRAVSVIGHLPLGLSHAAAVLLDGRLFIAGGRSGGRAQDAIWEVDPRSGMIRLAGRLPRPCSDAAAVTLGGIGYLVGGEDTTFLRSVVSISLG
jgi:hypothetical protein